MGYLSRSYDCSCGHSYRDLVDSEEDQTSPCPECGTVNSYSLGFPGIASFSLMDKEGRKASLMKRATEHTKKKIM